MTAKMARMVIPPGFPNANIVAYLTAPGDPITPRLTVVEMRSFLEIMTEAYRLFRAVDDVWISTVSRVAHDCALMLFKYPESYRPKENIDRSAYLNPVDIKIILGRLKELFVAFEFYGLAASRSYNEELDAFIHYASLASDQKGLFLSPQTPPADEDLTFLDPFPSIAPLIEQPENWPGILFWSRRGATAFAPLREAEKLFPQLLDSLGSHRVDEVLETYRSKRSSQKLLHLSDLHFGTRWAAENEAYLSAHLDEVARSVNRIVVTGDLFNNPRREDAIGFRNFRASLSRLTGKEVVVIPGNHDQKWLGNVGSPLKELANLEWSNLVIDNDMQCVLFCFDSSRDADLAKGRVNREQMMEIATAFETRCVGNPNGIVDYLRVALIHHHPFSFETGRENIIQRALHAVGLTDEYFLRMDDADSFIIWCLKKDIPLILHGHKHVQRHVRKRYETRGLARREITSVGCGSSLGAEGKPLSYNLLAWDPLSKSWAVSFYSDPGDGSGFTRQQIALHTL